MGDIIELHERVKLIEHNLEQLLLELYQKGIIKLEKEPSEGDKTTKNGG